MINLLLILLLQAAGSQAGISGTVVDADTLFQLPIVDARIELNQPGRTPVLIRTGVDGQFSASGLAPGSYRLTVTANGFIRMSLPGNVAAGQQRRGIVLALKPASTISGRIRDEYNVPEAHLIVEAMKVIYGPRGDRSAMAFASTLSDERGEFNLALLDPGDYYIRALSLPDREGFAFPGNPPEDPARRIYAPTYFPGTRDSSEASRIHVGIGAKLKGLEWKMQTGFVGIQGHVSTVSGNISISTKLAIEPVGNVASIQKFETKSGDDGEFRVSGIPIGTYVISAQTSLSRESLAASRKFTIKAQERAFMLRMSSGVTVAGQVTSSPGKVIDPRLAKVVLESIDPDLPSAPAVPVDASGGFHVDRIQPGDYVIRVIGLPGNAYIEGASSGNSDILSQPLHVEYDSPAPVTVRLAIDGGHMSGAIRDNDNHLVAGAKVVLVPNASRREIVNQFLTAESRDDGVFELSGIPPGEYTVFAWQIVEPNIYLDPSFLQRYETSGTRVTISAGSDVTATLPLNPID